MALILLLALGGWTPAQAQDALLEALVRQRLRVRVAEVLRELPPRPVVFGPMDLTVDDEEPRIVSQSLPARRLALPAVTPLDPRPRPAAPVEAEPMTLTEIRWARVPAGEEDAFVARFGDALWTNVNPYAQTEIDRMPTPEVRGRLNHVFGQPTRSPVGRGRPEMTGSGYVQFEYWFTVNDGIPFVVMDRNGPFGRGVVLVADEAHAPLLAELKQDLTRLLLLPEELMPYSDYFQDRETGQWYLTGYDGSDYYIRETERPRWARRGDERGSWYEFR